MKGIASTGAPKTLLDGWMDGWMGGWMGGKAGLRIAYSNQKHIFYSVIKWSSLKFSNNFFLKFFIIF
jgi:hypothetical protein